MRYGPQPAGITVGNTYIPLSGSATAVNGATLEACVLSGATTLPGSGLLTSAGELGLGADPTAQARFFVGGTYLTGNANAIRLAPLFRSTVTSIQRVAIVNPTIEPQGASITSVIGEEITPSLNIGALALTSYTMHQVAPTIAAGSSGAITLVAGYRASGITNSGTSVVAAYTQFAGASIANGNGITTGSVTNRQYRAEGITAGAAGGIANNRSVEITMPSGGASSGTANNRGLYITGNGGTAAGGTVNNFAIHSDSTAMSLLTGGLTVATTTLLTTSVALTNGAAAQAGTLLNAPAAGNPTKWIPINDNGTTRYLPAW